MTHLRKLYFLLALQPCTLGEWRAGWVPAKRRKPERNILPEEKWKRMKEGLA